MDKNTIQKVFNQTTAFDNDKNPLFSEPKLVDENTWHCLPTGVPWATEKVEVNGRKGRRVACLLAQDRLHYRVYDLDHFPDASENDPDAAEDSEDQMS